MKLEVEIDLTDEQWGLVKEDMGNTHWNYTDVVLAAVLAARDAALHPIQVGDRVTLVNGSAPVGEVLATDGDQVWVKWDHGRRSTLDRSDLRRVTGGEA